MKDPLFSSEGVAKLSAEGGTMLLDQAATVLRRGFVSQVPTVPTPRGVAVGVQEQLQGELFMKDPLFSSEGFGFKSQFL
jgi:hypothetical protein